MNTAKENGSLVNVNIKLTVKQLTIALFHKRRIVSVEKHLMRILPTKILFIERV